MRKWAAFAFAATVLGCGGDDSTGPSATRIRISNQSSATIAGVYYSDCTDPSFGPNRLTSGGVIARGADRDFDVSPGCYDIGVETTDGREAEMAAAQVDRGKTFTFKITNF